MASKKNNLTRQIARLHRSVQDRKRHELEAKAKARKKKSPVPELHIPTKKQVEFVDMVIGKEGNI